MNTFKEFLLLERYVNIFTREDKEKVADEVWNLIQTSYAPIGGTKGFGFSSKEDFIQNIPFWKLLRKGSRIIAAVVYRDKEGRKVVAVATDGSPDGKIGLLNMLKAEFETGRSYAEISGTLLKFTYNKLGEDFILRYATKPSEVKTILKGDDILPIDSEDSEAKIFPTLKDFFYRREIGGHLHTKILLGRSGNPIKL